jgi:recombinational DNA repair ATPase RecF
LTAPKKRTVVDSELLRLVEERLAATGVAGESWATLILAACDGEGRLATALEGEDGKGTAGNKPARVAKNLNSAGAYLRSISIEGFRGIGAKATLELTPGPGLTLVIGRNGSGKSSFAEGLEILLTNTNWRWRNRSVVWQGGWRNLHRPSPSQVSAEFAIEGESGVTTISRRWKDDAELEDSTLKVSLASKKSADLDSLGWTSALEAYRPFLSYNELGSMFDEGPTKLHDKLSTILGLGELDQAAAALRQARLDREAIVNAPKRSLPALVSELEDVDDGRARQAEAAIAGRKWDLDAIRRLIGGVHESDDGVDTVAILRSLATLETPTPEEIKEIVARLRVLADKADALADDDTRRLGETHTLLEEAVEFHEHHGDGDCPVCGTKGVFTSAWRKSAFARLKELEARTADWQAARAETQELLTEVYGMLARPPADLHEAADVGVDTKELTKAWSAFSEPPTKPNLRQLADHLEKTSPAVDRASRKVRASASAELDRREGEWRPAAARLAAWLSEAERAEGATAQVAQLKQAERWLQDASAELRQQRFAPIADETIKNWKKLRQQSSVELVRIALEGSRTQRKVTLDVDIDGVGAAALGVMSQGELHSIGLSMFLPRAMLPESPFRFVVIDDPVQSMDPARVDGLARVLAETAKTRQVIVFTHDDRLPESARRLGIDATVIEVTRHEDSVVELRESSDPVERNLDDANALVNTKSMPVELAQEVVPGYCRNAIEAAAIEVVRRRRIGRGESHAAVESLLENKKTRDLLSLAIWDNAARGGEVTKEVAKRWGDDLADALSIAVSGTHIGYRGSLDVLVTDTRRLCAKITGLGT